MMRETIIATGLALALAASARGDVAADASGDPPVASRSSAAAPRIQAAPGGGEMIVLGTEFQYVIRARGAARTAVRATCEHDAPAAAAAAAAMRE